MKVNLLSVSMTIALAVLIYGVFFYDGSITTTLFIIFGLLIGFAGCIIEAKQE